MILLEQGQYFSGDGPRIYMLGNPIIWWGNLLFMAVYLVLFFVFPARNLRGIVSSAKQQGIRKFARYMRTFKWTNLPVFLLHAHSFTETHIARLRMAPNRLVDPLRAILGNGPNSLLSPLLPSFTIRQHAIRLNSPNQWQSILYLNMTTHLTPYRSHYRLFNGDVERFAVKTLGKNLLLDVCHFYSGHDLQV